MAVGALLAVWSLATPVPVVSAGITVSEYDAAFTHAPGLANMSAVDLVAVSSVDTGGPTINVSFAVSGKLSLEAQNSEYSYWVYFGGTNVRNGVAYAAFEGPSPGSWHALTPSAGAGRLNYTVGDGGASLNFSINKTVVGPASNYSLTACAWFTLDYPPGSSTYSCLGAIYPSGCGTAPTACATLSARITEVGYRFTNGCDGLPAVVNFTGLASGGVPPYTYSWTFGDGTPGWPYQNASHEYASYGHFVVNLTVFDSLGAKGYSNVTASYAPPGCNAPPAAASPATGALTAGLAVGVAAVAAVLCAIYLRRKH